MERPVLQCKTTPGVGDYMFALNKALWASWFHNNEFEVEFHWKHAEDHLHHYEDPETIVDRFEYTLPFYLEHDRLKITHHFDCPPDTKLERKRFLPNKSMRMLGFNSMAKVEHGTSEWMFRPTHLKTNDNKVVIWRPLFNAEEARGWKWVVTNDMWNEIIDILEVMGYDVVELSYRTPIREAHYHIATCNFVVCYDGMWHYFAKNYFKPMIVASRSAITKLHTPHALMLHDLEITKRGEKNRHIVKQMRKLHTPCPEYGGQTLHEFITNKANRYKTKFERFYNENRSRRD